MSKNSMSTWTAVVAGSLLTACSPSAPPVPGAREEAALVIDGATLWDGTGRAPVPDAVIVIRGDRIADLGPRGSATVPSGARIVSAGGKFVIPGLINMHGHVGMTRGLAASRDNYTRENVLAQLRQYARYGVTTVMSLGTDFEPIFEVRGPAGPDESPRSTVFTAGRGFTGKNGYPAVLPGNAGVPREVDTADEVRDNVSDLARQKVDMVKIWVDDHWGHYEKIRPDLYRSIIDESHKRNLRVMAHVFYLQDAKSLVEAGVDGIAHSVRDKEVDDVLVRLIKERDVFTVATLVREESTFIYAQPPAFLDDPFFSRHVDPEVVLRLKDPAWGARVRSDPDFPKYPGQLKTAQRNLKRLADGGVRIGFGSDSGPPARFQGFFEHRELELMVEAGLSPADALKAATSTSADCLRIAADFGTLERGKRADLLLLDADPLADIRNTRRIHTVWIGGREVE